MRKKLFALLMSFVMIVTFMPTMAFTSFAETSQQTTTSSGKYVYAPLTGDLDAGKYLVAYTYDMPDMPTVMPPTAMKSAVVKGGMGCTTLRLSDGVIKKPKDAAVWDVEVSGDAVTFKTGGKYLAKDNKGILTLAESKYEWSKNANADNYYGNWCVTYDYTSMDMQPFFAAVNPYPGYGSVQLYKQTDRGSLTTEIVPAVNANRIKTVKLASGDALNIKIKNDTNDTITYKCEVSGDGTITGKNVVSGNATVNGGQTDVVTFNWGSGTAEQTKVIITGEKAAGSPYCSATINIIKVGPTEEDGDDTDPSDILKNGENIAITSDVHGSITNLDEWQKSIKSALSALRDKAPENMRMLFGGDYSYAGLDSGFGMPITSTGNYLDDCKKVAKTTKDNDLTGIYTSGNHEYQTGQGTTLDYKFDANEVFGSAFQVTGWAVDPTDSGNAYGVYCLGAAGWFDAEGEYPTNQIKQLKSDLSSKAANIDKPIFVLGHFPLHYYSDGYYTSRAITNANKVIKALNKYPNVIFLWGHNHSQGDTHYGEILTPGSELEYAKGTKSQIRFTYACAGVMYTDTTYGQDIDYKGLIANVYGQQVGMQYFGCDGKAVSDTTVVDVKAGNSVEIPDRTITVIPVKDSSSVSGSAVSSTRNITLIKDGKVKVKVKNIYSGNATYTCSGNARNIVNISGDANLSNIESGETGLFKIEAVNVGKDDITVTATNGAKVTLHVEVVELNSGQDEDDITDALDAKFASNTNLGIMADVHGNVSGFKLWQKNVMAAISGNPVKNMLFCGDLADGMDYMNLPLATYGKIYDACSGTGIFTSGDNEYFNYMNMYSGAEVNTLDATYKKIPKFYRIGEAVDPSKADNKYGVYCLGAAGSVGKYPINDIKALDKYLREKKAENKPIFVMAHFPLHYNMMSPIANADKLIEVLNQYPNVVFLWGHNHTVGDTHYGEILTPGSDIECATGKKQIRFTYACAGAMAKDGNTAYKGLLANVDGSKVTMQYFGNEGEVESDAITYDVTAGKKINDPSKPALFDVELTPSAIGQTVEYTIKKGESFELGVDNKSQAACTYNVSSDATSVATVDKTSISVSADASEKLIVTANEKGYATITVANGTDWATLQLTVLDEDGSAPEINVITPSYSNPSIDRAVDVNGTLDFELRGIPDTYTIEAVDDTVAQVGKDGVSGNAKRQTITLEYGVSGKFTIVGLKKGTTRIKISSKYAGTAIIYLTVGQFTGKKYLALGDSIGAGVMGGTTQGEDSDYQDFTAQGPNGEKNIRVDAVSYSYVKLFADGIGADVTKSYNATSAGFRSKEMCAILNLAPLKANDYNYSLEQVTWDDLNKVGYNIDNCPMDDYFGYSFYSTWENQFNTFNRNRLRSAIKDAEIITIELGANDLNAYLQRGPLTREIVPQLTEIMGKIQQMGNTQAAKNITKLMDEITELLNNPGEASVTELINAARNLQSIGDIGESVQGVGDSLTKLINSLVDSIQYAKKSYQHYWTTLLDEIRKENKTARIIVTSIPNPLTNSDRLKNMNLSMFGLGSIQDLIANSTMDSGKLLEPFINDMNEFLIKNASKYNYQVADISAVELNPVQEDTGEADERYSFHPNDEGHKLIYNALMDCYNNPEQTMTSKTSNTGLVLAAVAGVGIAGGAIASIAAISKLIKGREGDTHRHKWDSTYTVDKKASLDADGQMSIHCSGCDEVKDVKTIPRAEISLDATKLTYNGEVQTPTVVTNGLVEGEGYTVTKVDSKAVGKYSVSVKLIGKYEGETSLAYTIKPQSTTIKTLKSGSKSFTVKWKKLTAQTSGYQIRYSTSKDMSGAKSVRVTKNTTVSKKINKLKAKQKYYVQIRTYKKVDGANIYSVWSETSSVKTAK